MEPKSFSNFKSAQGAKYREYGTWKYPMYELGHGRIKYS